MAIAHQSFGSDELKMEEIGEMKQGIQSLSFVFCLISHQISSDVLPHIWATFHFAFYYFLQQWIYNEIHCSTLALVLEK